MGQQDRAVILDNPQTIARFRLALLITAFSREVNGGLPMTSRMPTVQAVVRQYGLEGVHTKAQLVDALVKLRDSGKKLPEAE